MNICVMTTSYPLRPDHYAGAFVHDLAARLVQRGHQVRVVAPHAAGALANERIDGVEVRRFRYMWPAALERLAYNGGIPANLKRRPAGSLAQALPFGAAFLAAGLSAARGCDLLHAHFAPTATVATVVARARRIPVVLTVHGTDVRGVGSKGPASAMVRWGVLRCDRIICAGRELAESLARWGVDERRLAVIPNGVDAEFFARADPAPAGHRILFVGRLAPEKGVEHLIQAMPAVLAKFPDAKLLLVGDGPLLGDVRDQVTRLGLTDSVQFAGRQPRSAMPRWYGEATLVVLPSIQESFGVVLIEAMASGRAVVASRVGGIPEVLADGECGLLVPPGDSSELAQAISRLLADDHERASLAAKGRARVEAIYRSEAVVDRLIDVYNETRESFDGSRRLTAAAH